MNGPVRWEVMGGGGDWPVLCRRGRRQQAGPAQPGIRREQAGNTGNTSRKKNPPAFIALYNINVTHLKFGFVI